MNARRILVVEDNAGTLKMAQVALERAGYAVSPAADARAAIDAMKAARADLVLQDMVLPDMDGFELVRALRSLEGCADVPVIAYSGFLSRSEEARVVAAGFNEFLVKPVEPARLVETVAIYLPLESRSKDAPGKGRLVLVVDDDPVQRKLLATHLERLGFQVATARDGEEALEAASERVPDAIASDVLMPQLNGFGLCLAARRDPELAKVPIVLFSASYTEEADARVARNVGADAFVIRTPDCRDVLDAIVYRLGASLPRAPKPEPTGPAPAPLPLHRFLQHLERQAGASAGLAQQCSIQAAGLGVLGAIADALARSRDLDAALERALACCLEAGGIAAGAVFLSGKGGRLELRAMSGLDDERAREAKTLFGLESLLASVVDSGRARAFPDAKGRNGGSPHPLLERARVESALLVPLVLHEERLGALFLASSRRDLTEPDWLSFARTVAVQLAQAVLAARAFERLAASERRYRGLMEHANDAIFVLDARGRVLEANRRAEEMLGVPAALVVGRTQDAFRELLRENGARLVDLPLERADGRIVYADVSASSLEHAGERVLVAIARDATPRKRAAEEQARLYAKANEAILARDEVLAALSSEIAREGQASRSLEALAGELALLSKVARGELDLRSEEVDLAALAGAVVERSREELAAAGCPVVLRAGEAVPGKWDRERLERVVGSLVAAAARRGRGEPIEVAVGADGARGLLTVTDCGAFSPDDEKRIFGRLEEAVSVRAGSGLGLGLWLAHEIVVAAGGTIRVASRSGGGTTVSVVLPR